MTLISNPRTPTPKSTWTTLPLPSRSV